MFNLIDEPSIMPILKNKIIVIVDKSEVRGVVCSGLDELFIVS